MASSYVNETVKTSAIAVFLNTSTTSTAVWSRIGKQSELGISYNVETTEENYIDEDGPTTEAERYTVSFDGEYVAYGSDEVFQYLDAKRIARATGTNAQTQVLLVYKFKKETKSNVDHYDAELSNCTVAITEFGGEGGGGKAHINYTITLNGDPSAETVTISGDPPRPTIDTQG